jgi:hypothetical protein
MSLQIDLKPVSVGESFTSHYLKIYFNGNCFTAIVSADTAREMEAEGLVEQIRGQREENGETITFDLPNGVDSAGVKCTSKQFIEKTNP